MRKKPINKNDDLGNRIKEIKTYPVPIATIFGDDSLWEWDLVLDCYVKTDKKAIDTIYNSELLEN